VFRRRSKSSSNYSSERASAYAVCGASIGTRSSLSARRMAVAWMATCSGSTTHSLVLVILGESLLRRPTCSGDTKLFNRLCRPARYASSLLMPQDECASSSWHIRLYHLGINFSPPANPPGGEPTNCEVLAGQPERAFVLAARACLVCRHLRAPPGCALLRNGGLYPIYVQTVGSELCPKGLHELWPSSRSTTHGRVCAAVTAPPAETIELALEALNQLEDRDTANRCTLSAADSSGPSYDGRLGGTAL